MVRRSIDEHGRVTEFMPILFKIMVCCRKRLENPGEESALFAGAMNNLTESLCQDIEWFSSDLPTASQNSLRPIITGLYDIALIFCLDSDDLDARTKISAAEKIIACRDRFTAQFSTPTPDLVIVSIDNGLQLLQLYLDGKTQVNLELLLCHLYTIPWGDEESTATDLMPFVQIMLFLTSPDCKLSNSVLNSILIIYFRGDYSPVGLENYIWLAST